MSRVVAARGVGRMYTLNILYIVKIHIYIYIHIRIAQPGMQNAEFKYQDHLMVWPWHAPLLICRWAFIQDIQGSLILSCCGGRVLKLLRLSTRCQCMLGYLPDRISSSIYMIYDDICNILKYKAIYNMLWTLSSSIHDSESNRPHAPH